MMDNVFELILGHEQVVSWFGYWPNFHDAEVHWIKLQQHVPLNGNGPFIELMLHTWDFTDQIKIQGFRVTQKHCLIHIRFENCQDIELEGFSYQNVLFGLDFTMDSIGRDKHLKVALDASQGVSISFKCSHVEIWGITPCDEKGVPLSS